tara:strand:- start:464 stop:1282 length:819 start_codon:yes stop_codon:yes gene_type:complete
MKRILLLLLLLFSFTLFAQSEKEQKIQKKVESNQSSTPSSSSNNSTNNSSSNWNTNNNWNNNNHWNSRRYNNRYYYDPYYYPNSRWGWNNPRSRRYSTSRSSNQTIISPRTPLKLVLGLGISSSIISYHPATIGGRFIAGNENYYVFFGIERSQPNPYIFYDNIDMWDVFGWDDYVEDYYFSNNTYFGIAVHAGNNFYPHLSFGNVTSTRYLLCMDETLVLSPDGNYTILGETRLTSTFGIGLDYRYNHLLFTSTIGITGPNRLSLGINFIL